MIQVTLWALGMHFENNGTSGDNPDAARVLHPMGCNPYASSHGGEGIVSELLSP